jgi:hypothetical protein
MRTSRAIRPAVFRTAAAFVITTALAAGPLAAAGPAFAADATVASVATADDGTLTVALSDGDALWVKVSVRASADADAAVLASTDQLSYDSGRGGWYTVSPVGLPAGAAYGDYPVDVDYRLPGGTVQHWSGAEHGTSGLLSYRLHTGIGSLAFDRAYTDYAHQDAVLSGTVTTFDPATGTTAPAAAGLTVKVGYQVYRDGNWVSPSLTATTGADGSFSATVTPGGHPLYGTAAVVDPGADTEVAPASGLPELAVVQTRYRISAKASAARVYKGKAFTESGTVEQLTKDGWKPLPDAPVVTATREPDTTYNTVSGLIGSGSSNASGAFSYAAAPTATTTHYTFVRPSAYLTVTEPAQDSVTVPRTATFSKVTASLDAYKVVTAKGRLAPYNECEDEKVQLQYSANGSSGWKTLASAEANFDNSFSYCTFSVKAVGRVTGYYRVKHDESYDLLAVASGGLKRSRIETRITGFDMTPNRPALNGKLTAKGVLQYKSGGKWKAYKGGRIVLVLKPKGDSSWYWVVKGTTDSKGRFSLKTKAYEDGTWATYLNPDSKHFYSESKTEYVNAG